MVDSARSTHLRQSMEALRQSALAVRSLCYYWRTSLAVALGAAVGTATLTGALFVGDSMRASLRRQALQRLGPVDHAMMAQRFVRERLAEEIARDSVFRDRFAAAIPAISLRGSAAHAESQAFARRVHVYGVDERFWSRFDASVAAPANREVILNEPLAHELGAKSGDDVLLRFGSQSAISPETLLGRRDQSVASLRMTVAAIVPDEGVGGLGLAPTLGIPRNAFVPLATLQRTIGEAGRVNVIFVENGNKSDSHAAEGDGLSRILRKHVTLEDLDLLVRTDDALRYVALESHRFLLEPAAERAGRLAAEQLGVRPLGILTYLANTIEIGSKDNGESLGQTPPADHRQTIPYSTVAALDVLPEAMPPFELIDGTTVRDFQTGGIYLNEWASRDLGRRTGDRIRLAYYVLGAFGNIETQTAMFDLRGIIRLAGLAEDRGFTPEYPGVTDAQTIADWDPPFPVDLKKIQDQDEAYWERYHTAPKAFVALADGQRLWAHDAERFGRLTSLRIPPPADRNVRQTAADFEAKLREHLDPAALGLRFEPLRRRALEAGAGSTDFGVLFLAFSLFLVISAAMLVALLFRLHVERRSAELGLLLALGFSPAAVLRLLLREGAAIAVAGSLLGMGGAYAFAWLMMIGIQSWWSGILQTSFLELHLSISSMATGAVVGLFVAMVSLASSLGRLTRANVRSLLSGTGSAPSSLAGKPNNRRSLIIMITALLVAETALASTLLTDDSSSQSLFFFVGGTGLLVAALTLAHRHLLTERRGVLRRPGWATLALLGERNTARQPRRSLLTVALMASATFVIVAVDVFRVDPQKAVGTGRQSAAGGFQLVAESSTSLTFDLNTAAGREGLNLPDTTRSAFEGVTTVPFRLQPGDQTSCLNLYRPTAPRLLGATSAMMHRGGFAFSATLAETESEKQNPWLLLRRTFADGAIPVIGDESAVRWQLRLGLGRDFVLTDERGGNVRLRFVALLHGSILQSELIVSEENFKALYPSSAGYAFFLIEAPSPRVLEVTQALERGLTSFGFDATPAQDRLAEYMKVQNMYLSTFQLLGGFGLVLGAFGLVAVMLRNVWERRSEFALLQALGFRPAAVYWVVLWEDAVLLAMGLAGGAVPAFLAAAPHLWQRVGSLPWGTLVATFLCVIGIGIGVGTVALLVALKAPLIPALRSE